MNTSSWTVGAKLEWLATKNERLNYFLYYFENFYPSSRSRFLMVTGDCLETKRNPGPGFQRKQELAPWFNIWIGEIPSYINTWLVSYHVLLLGSKITIGMTLGGRKLGRWWCLFNWFRSCPSLFCTLVFWRHILYLEGWLPMTTCAH